MRLKDRASDTSVVGPRTHLSDACCEILSTLACHKRNINLLRPLLGGDHGAPCRMKIDHVEYPLAVSDDNCFNRLE